MEIAETGTATTSGLAKTLRHFGLDTRTPGLQREDRRAELQKRLGEFERARRVPPPPTNLLSRKSKQAPAPPHSSLAPPAGPTRGAPPPPSSPSRKDNKIGRPLLIPPPPPAEHTRVREDVQSTTEEKTNLADGEVRGPQRAPKRLPESKLPDTSFDCDVCGLSFKKVAHLIVHSRSHNRDKPSRASQPVSQPKSTIRGKIDQAKYPSSSDEDDQDSEEDNNGGADDDDDDDDDADILNEQSHSHFDDAGDVRGLVEGLSIAEDNQDANSTLESKTRDRADNADATHDEAWIEEFARGLVQIARQSGAATRSPKSKSTPQRAPAVLRKMRTAPARALVPPPRGAPPLHLARTASAHAVLVSPKHKREGLRGRDWNDKQAIHDGTDADALRREIEELDRKRAARIRIRLHESKDVEIQEAEWDLQRVQQELRRVERHRGIFIDSRFASQNGHMQRWAKEDLLPKLEALEREANARLEQEISRIRAEEESHPQYGRQAQNERRFKLHQMQNRHGSASLDDDASMSAIRGGGPNGSRQRADADEIGREALALHMGKRDLARAETLYRRALALDGRHATNLGNFALFIQQFGTSQHGRRDEENKSIEDSGHRNRAHDDGDESYRKACDAQADKFYRQAISADPSHSTNLANYASFLHKNLRQYERAEQYYERAVHEAPANASILGNFAVFLFRVRRDLVRADRMFQRALEIDPKHVNNCCNYASLLKKGFGKHRKAQALYEDALKIDPENPTVLCNYANMLVKGADPADASPEACAQIQKARDLYLLALRVNPSHRMAKRNYMIFLRDFPTVRNMANERKLSEARPPPGPRPPQVHAGRVVSPPTSPTSPTSPKSRRRSKRSRSPHAAARRPMSPTLETLIE